MTIEPSTKVSGTRAMMAASALHSSAHKQEGAAKLLDDEFPKAAENCRELGRWYTEVAEALEKLDHSGTQIVRAGA